MFSLMKLRNPRMEETRDFTHDHLHQPRPPSSHTTSYIAQDPVLHPQPPTSRTTPYITHDQLHHPRPPTSRTTYYITQNLLHHDLSPQQSSNISSLWAGLVVTGRSITHVTHPQDGTGQCPFNTRFNLCLSVFDEDSC